MIIGVECKTCAQVVKVTGNREDLQETGTAFLDEVEVFNNGTFYIKLFRCPYCGQEHTVQIDTKQTKDILHYSLQLMAKQRERTLDLSELKLEQKEDGINHQKKIAALNKEIKRLRKKGINNDKRLELKRAELSTIARGLTFNRVGTGLPITYELFEFKSLGGKLQ